MITEITNYKIITVGIPEEFVIHKSLYQCAGVPFNPVALDGPHFELYQDEDLLGLFPSVELFLGYFADEEYQMQCGGYFCEDCIKGMGYRTEGRVTLSQIIEYRKWFEKG